MSRIAALVAVLLLSLVSFTTQAAPGWLATMSRTPMSEFSDEDVDLFLKNGQTVLNDTADGESRSWQNEKTGHSGTAKVVKSGTQDGQRCRLVQIENQSKNYFNRSMLNFCQQPDGTWQWVKPQ